MEVSQVRAFLHRHSRIALDTSIFIYQLEANPHYKELTKQIFSWLEKPGNSAVASTLVMTELLVVPYRNQNIEEANDYLTYLTTFPNLEWIPPTLEIADLAACYRADYRLQTPDAFYAATAAHMQATAFITNDVVFSRISSFSTLVLGRVV